MRYYKSTVSKLIAAGDSGVITILDPAFSKARRKHRRASATMTPKRSAWQDSLTFAAALEAAGACSALLQAWGCIGLVVATPAFLESCGEEQLKASMRFRIRHGIPAL